jgi:RND family efflux transporter MFP subunit
VAKQDVDDRQVAFEASRADEAAARANVDALEASVAAAQANVTANEASVRRLEELQSFQKVSAPFDGIITARNTDVGALIDAAGTSSGKELFHLSAIGTLRVYVSLPQTYARVAQPGATASLTLDEFPGVSFHGKLVRTANAIDSASRTLLAEIVVENPAGQLLPGAYVSVHFTLPHSGALTIPANTLLFRGEGLRVGLVRGGQVELVPVMIGRDFGSVIEVVSGLQPSDAVIVDPTDSLVTGMAVRVRE